MNILAELDTPQRQVLGQVIKPRAQPDPTIFQRMQQLKLLIVNVLKDRISAGSDITTIEQAKLESKGIQSCAVQTLSMLNDIKAFSRSTKEYCSNLRALPRARLRSMLEHRLQAR